MAMFADPTVVGGVFGATMTLLKKYGESHALDYRNNKQSRNLTGLRIPAVNSI
jgi:pyruvate/2-oxoglutarate/acetoin dehydrogenase E1 component